MLEFRELPESKIKISQLNYVNFDKLQPRLACFIVIVQHPHAMMSPQRTISILRHWFSSLSCSPSLPTTANPLHIKNSFPILWAHENCVQCLSILWVPSVFYILKRFMWLISTAVARWKEYSFSSFPQTWKKSWGKSTSFKTYAQDSFMWTFERACSLENLFCGFDDEVWSEGLKMGTCSINFTRIMILN